MFRTLIFSPSNRSNSDNSKGKNHKEVGKVRKNKKPQRWELFSALLRPTHRAPGREMYPSDDGEKEKRTATVDTVFGRSMPPMSITSSTSSQVFAACKTLYYYFGLDVPPWAVCVCTTPDLARGGLAAMAKIEEGKIEMFQFVLYFSSGSGDTSRPDYWNQSKTVLFAYLLALARRRHGVTRSPSYNTTKYLLQYYHR